MSRKNKYPLRIEILVKKSDGFDEAVAFTEDRYKEKLNAIPDKSSEYLVAFDGLKIVGNISINWFPKENTFCEKAYFIPESLAKSFSREEAVYFSKFTSLLSFVTPFLMYHAALRGIETSCSSGIAILEDKMIRFLKRSYDLDWQLLSDQLISEEIPDQVLPYFKKSPSPKLYIISLKEMTEILHPQIMK